MITGPTLLPTPAGKLIGAEAARHVDRPKVAIPAFRTGSETTRCVVLSQSRDPQYRAKIHSPFPIGPLVFSIKNTISRSARSAISTLSPVSRIKLGISITDNGSVQ